MSIQPTRSGLRLTSALWTRHSTSPTAEFGRLQWAETSGRSVVKNGPKATLTLVAIGKQETFNAQGGADVPKCAGGESEADICRL